MEVVTVLIVDDHPVVRQGLRFMLQDLPGVEILGEACSGQEAMIAAERLRPSLVLMDLRMPDMDGLEATRRLKEGFPSIKVVMLTVSTDNLSIMEALQSGADGYVSKNAPAAEIHQALLLAASGSVAIRSSLLQGALGSKAPEPSADPHPIVPGRRTGLAELTPRELEVLRLVARGKTNKEIARELVIAPATAKKHVERIVAKLSAADRTEAATTALRLGLVD